MEPNAIHWNEENKIESDGLSPEMEEFKRNTDNHGQEVPLHLVQPVQAEKQRWRCRNIPGVTKWNFSHPIQ